MPVVRLVKVVPAMTVEIDNCVAIAETEKALLVEIEGEEYWFPKSQIDEDSEVHTKGTEGTLVVTKWIADKNNLL